jgi:hypothetical protein
MSRDPDRAVNAVITKLAAMYLFRPFLKGSGVSRKTKRPYSAMKRLIPGIDWEYSVRPMRYGN